MRALEEIVDGDTTWRFDADFLQSRWTCIYGQGCLGIGTEPAEHLGHGCCSIGAELDGDDEARLISALSAMLQPERFEHHAHAAAGGVYADGRRSATRVVDGACIFLNRPGFPGGPGCALHLAALDADESPVDWKPSVCWQLPLRLIEHTDEHGYVTSTLREWKRRDWGEGGRDFHWWCTESDDAFVGTIPVYEYLHDEITEFIGPKIYALLLEQLKARKKPGKPLPHPAVRR